MTHVKAESQRAGSGWHGLGAHCSPLSRHPISNTSVSLQLHGSRRNVHEDKGLAAALLPVSTMLASTLLICHEMPKETIET